MKKDLKHEPKKNQSQQNSVLDEKLKDDNKTVEESPATTSKNLGDKSFRFNPEVNQPSNPPQSGDIEKEY